MIAASRIAAYETDVTLHGFAKRAGHVAAVLAVMLLSFATSRASVMQMADTAMGVVKICSVTSAGTPRGQAHGQVGKAQRTCAFCAAATHAPLCADEVVLRTPGVVVWTPHGARTARGPRGPPAFRAQARGPPHLS